MIPAPAPKDASAPPARRWVDITRTVWFHFKSLFIDYPGKPPWRQVVDTVVSAFLLALLIRWLLLQAFFIPSGSMENTLLKDDRILVSKIQYYLRQPERGEVIVFWFEEEKKHFIKRVIGLPGDRIEMVGKKLFVNNALSYEPYVVHKDPNMDPTRDHYRPQTVPKDRFFVMGDNRDFSKDSRFWGYVKEKDVVGKAFFIYWPVQRMGAVK